MSNDTKNNMSNHSNELKFLLIKKVCRKINVNRKI